MDGVTKEIKHDGNGGDTLTIKVVNQDNIETLFKIKPGTSMSKLMRSYCDRLALNPSAVRFMYNGVRIGDDETAKSLEMENEDIVDVMVQQTGGALPSARTAVPAIKNLYTLTICYGNATYVYKMFMSQTFYSAMMHFCTKSELPFPSMSFFTDDNKEIFDDQTPEETQLPDCSKLVARLRSVQTIAQVF